MPFTFDLETCRLPFCFPIPCVVGATVGSILPLQLFAFRQTASYRIRPQSVVYLLVVLGLDTLVSSDSYAGCGRVGDVIISFDLWPIWPSSTTRQQLGCNRELQGNGGEFRVRNLPSALALCWDAEPRYPQKVNKELGPYSVYRNANSCKVAKTINVRVGTPKSTAGIRATIRPRTLRPLR